MLEGTCPHCGFHRVGWALRYPRHQTCPICGTGLDIVNGSRWVFQGYSPFTAESEAIRPPDTMPLPQGEDNAAQV